MRRRIRRRVSDAAASASRRRPRAAVPRRTGNPPRTTAMPYAARGGAWVHRGDSAVHELPRCHLRAASVSASPPRPARLAPPPLARRGNAAPGGAPGAARSGADRCKRTVPRRGDGAAWSSAGLGRGAPAARTPPRSGYSLRRERCTDRSERVRRIAGHAPGVQVASTRVARTTVVVVWRGLWNPRQDVLTAGHDLGRSRSRHRASGPSFTGGKRRGVEDRWTTRDGSRSV